MEIRCCRIINARNIIESHILSNFLDVSGETAKSIWYCLGTIVLLFFRITELLQ